MNDVRPILVLGVGNVYYGDEGAGVHLVHHLRSKYSWPAGVDVMDGGTLGWHLLEMLAGYRRVVVIDAVAAPPGKIYRFGSGKVPDEVGYGKLSSHEWEVPDLLTAMELHGDLPEVTCVAIGVRPLSFETGEVGVALSAPVRDRMGALERTLLRELEQLGVTPTPLRPELRAEQPLSAEEIVLGRA